MASKVRIKFNIPGFRQLRIEPGVREDILRRAEAVAAAAGTGVEVLPVEEPRNRARVLVGPVTGEAARRIAPDNLLLRALEAGRD